jgi:hypothetical protein
MDLKYGYNNNKKKEKDVKIVTAEMNVLSSAADYIRKDEIRNTKIREELNIFNLNDKIIKSRSQCKYRAFQNDLNNNNTFHEEYNITNDRMFREIGTFEHILKFAQNVPIVHNPTARWQTN